MKTWSEEESWKYMERFRGYRRDMRCRECGWFGHITYHCRRIEIEAESVVKQPTQLSHFSFLFCYFIEA